MMQEYTYYLDSTRNFGKQIGSGSGYPIDRIDCDVCRWAGSGITVTVDGEECRPPALQVLTDFCMKLGHFSKCSIPLDLPHPNQRHYVTQEAARQALPEGMRAAAEALGRTAAPPASDEHATCSDHRAATESGRLRKEVSLTILL